MAQLVIDASIAGAWCLPGEETEFTNGVLKIIGNGMVPLAPALWGYEIRNTILMGLKRGRIAREAIDKLLLFLEDLNVELVQPASYSALFHLAQAHGLTVYDAARCRSPVSIRI